MMVLNSLRSLRNTFSQDPSSQEECFYDHMQFLQLSINHIPWSSDGYKNGRTREDIKKLVPTLTNQFSVMVQVKLANRDSEGNKYQIISTSRSFPYCQPKYTSCPACSVSLLPSRLTSRPVKTGFYFLFTVSVHIP